jgi:hypothetical protein
MDRPEDRRALIELLGPDGRVQHAVGVWQWPLTIGRALHNTLVLDDPHVASEHARIAPAEDGALTLTVGDTRNGLHLGHRLLRAGESAVLGDVSGRAELHIGTTRLRLRLPQEVLAPERALSPSLALQAPPRLGWLLVLAALLLVLVVGEQWVTLEPGAEFTDWLPMAVGAPLGALGWVLAWATASKLFRHRFEFLAHARIALQYGVVLSLLDMLLPQAAGALAWPWLLNANGWLQIIGLALWLRAHARQVLPQFDRVLTVITAAACVAAVAVMVTLNQRRFDRWQAPAYLSVLPLPALRWGATESAEQFVASSAVLRAPLEARVGRAKGDDDDGAEAGEDGAEESGN